MTGQAVNGAIGAALPPEETQQQAVARLAALPPLDYDRVREKEAERLGARASTLDKEVASARRPAMIDGSPAEMFPTIEPWHEPVNGAALLAEIYETVKQFIVCEKETAIAATLWIAFTWFVDQVQVAPLAVITAPEKRCGKSQLLDLIGRLSRRSLVASNISPAAIFRVIEAHGPTLLIDEADAFLKDNEEARGILNSGHTRQSAYVIRVVGDDHTPQQFSTWGAKAISGIGILADTLMDRAIVLELRRKLSHETVQRLRHADINHFQRLCSMLARYAEDAGPAIAYARPELPDALNDRAQDNWEPLLAIADHASEGWPDIARETALKLSSAAQDTTSISAELLADIQEIFETKTVNRITTRELLDTLNGDDMKPWATYNRGKPMSPRQLAKRLGEYNLRPQNLNMGGNSRPKGYYRQDLEEIFQRYLSPAHSIPENAATPLPSAEKPENTGDFSVAHHPLRSSSDNAPATAFPLKTLNSSGVADKQQISGMVEIEI